MNLPNGHLAIVEDAKLLDYVLSETHPIGKHHARLFAELLGIRRENAHVLKSALLAAAEHSAAVEGRSSPHGRKFEIRFDWDGLRGTKTVLSIWIIEPSVVGQFESQTISARHVL